MLSSPLFPFHPGLPQDCLLTVCLTKPHIDTEINDGQIRHGSNTKTLQKADSAQIGDQIVKKKNASRTERIYGFWRAQGPQNGRNTQILGKFLRSAGARIVWNKLPLANTWTQLPQIRKSLAKLKMKSRGDGNLRKTTRQNKTRIDGNFPKSTKNTQKTHEIFANKKTDNKGRNPVKMSKKSYRSNLQVHTEEAHTQIFHHRQSGSWTLRGFLIFDVFVIVVREIVCFFLVFFSVRLDENDVPAALAVC